MLSPIYKMQAIYGSNRNKTIQIVITRITAQLNNNNDSSNVSSFLNDNVFEKRHATALINNGYVVIDNIFRSDIANAVLFELQSMINLQNPSYLKPNHTVTHSHTLHTMWFKLIIAALLLISVESGRALDEKKIFSATKTAKRNLQRKIAQRKRSKRMKLKTSDPTGIPTDASTKSPTKTPTNYPTGDPTRYPTHDPTQHLTSDPTTDPTNHPTNDP
eukprot:530396_1